MKSVSVRAARDPLPSDPDDSFADGADLLRRLATRERDPERAAALRASADAIDDEAGTPPAFPHQARAQGGCRMFDLDGVTALAVDELFRPENRSGDRARVAGVLRRHFAAVQHAATEHAAELVEKQARRAAEILRGSKARG